jgi:cysteine-rich repeat protein
VLAGVSPSCGSRLSLLLLLGLGCNGGNITEAPETSTTVATESGDICVPGTFGCACMPGGICDPGLECTTGICAELPAETETGECIELGCDCVEGEEGEENPCGDGLICHEGSCVIDNCGDGVLDAIETCDDANQIDGDGCDNDCSLTQILELTLGGVHTCALIEKGRIRCWGHNGTGQIGYGAAVIGNIGDDELPSSAGDLPLPAAVDVVAGGAHTCAVFENGDARCWGLNTSGQLGLGNTATVTAVGDDETLEGLAKVELVAPANEIGVGVLQTCVRVSGQLRCWGGGIYGQLGLAAVANIGDNELPLDLPSVMLGGEPTTLAIGGYHGCAIMATGTLRCWGRNDTGQLGLGINAHVGDNEHPSAVAEVDALSLDLPLETSIDDIVAGLSHSCMLLSTGDVICWGAGSLGQLGQGNNLNWGDGPAETPAALTPIQLGEDALALAAGYLHTCALLYGGQVRCWGSADSGQLGNGDEEFVGLANVPSDRPPVTLPGPVISIAAGAAHTCVVFEDHKVSCWGSNEYGQLGYGHTEGIGDDELPMTAGFVPLL